MDENGTLQKILKSATAEFLEKGFNGSSLRDIVKKAGVTTGAFYGYYKSKNDLFDALVKDTADYLMNVYKSVYGEFASQDIASQATNAFEYSRIGMQKMLDYAFNHLDSIKLIYKCSAGTRYENFVQDLTNEDLKSTDVFYTTLQTLGKNPRTINPLSEYLILSGMFTSMFELLIKDISK